MLYELNDLNWDLTLGEMPPPASARPVLVSNQSVLSVGTDQWEIPGLGDAWRHLSAERLVDLGSIDDQRWVAIDWLALSSGEIAEVLGGADRSAWNELSLRDILPWSEHQFSLASRAVQLINWRRQHRYCGQCGGPTQGSDTEHFRWCDRCELRFYPRISPCIIVLVTRGDEVLLARGRRHRTRGYYSTLAGFMEAGESAEQAVHREVFEEVGVQLSNVRYRNSQTWPFPHQLMLGFTAEYAGGDLELQEDEIDAAQWWPLRDLPPHPPSHSISGWLIETYRREQLGA